MAINGAPYRSPQAIGRDGPRQVWYLCLHATAEADGADRGLVCDWLREAGFTIQVDRIDKVCRIWLLTWDRARPFGWGRTDSAATC